jgi:hypothetical protein
VVELADKHEFEMRVDVLDIGFPEPTNARASLELSHVESAFGTVESPILRWNGRPFCRLSPASQAWVSRVPGLPAEIRLKIQAWSVLSVLPSFGGSKSDLVTALRTILSTQPQWIVWYERDCEQRPVIAASMTVAEVETRLGTSDFVAWLA